MKCHLNGMQIDEVPKFLVETPSETTHAMQLINAACPLIIPLQLQGATSYFDILKVLQNMKMKRSLRFISLQKSHLGTHHQKNTQKEHLVWQTTKDRSFSLP